MNFIDGFDDEEEDPQEDLARILRALEKKSPEFQAEVKKRLATNMDDLRAMNAADPHEPAQDQREAIAPCQNTTDIAERARMRPIEFSEVSIVKGFEP